ncbi:MAG TPA: hypothetical protein VOA87_19660 [Thermoanaerobaculia bacterium]|nr:hypothetical protein [Thermoanaerobaculia bacterium]
MRVRAPRAVLALCLLIPASSASSAPSSPAGEGWSWEAPAEPEDGLFPAPYAAAMACGVERWSVKTGTDADAGRVNLSSTSSNTIATMRSWTAPSPIPSNNRVSPYETTVWVLNATLTEYKVENDEDYHLVLADSSGKTMIVEIPNPGCVGTGSPFAFGISNARAEFDAKFTPTTSFQTANIPVQITGVGMFDFLHGQTGVAPNGIELHPVLDVLFNPGSNPNFTLAVSPSAVTAAPGSSANTTVTTAVSGGFNSAVALSAAGLPAGASATFTPASIAAPGAGTSTLKLSAGTAAPGTYGVTVTGTGGGKTHTAPVSLTVGSGGGSQQLLLNPGFESGNVSWTASTSVITNAAGEAAHGGSWKAWLDGYGTTHTDTLYQQVAIPSTAASATLTFWLHVDTAETTTTTAYDTLKVQVQSSTGTVLATLATYSNLDHNTGYAQKSFNLLAYKGQTVRVYLVGAEDSIDQTSFVVDDFALNVQ